MAVIKGLEIANMLDIPKENVFLHTDSYICLYWIKKNAGELTVYVSNRAKVIQEAQVEVFYCEINHNPTENISKVKPISSYLKNPVCENGSEYMSRDDWKVGRSIEEIEVERSPTHEESKEIEEGLRKANKTIQLNVNQTSVTFSKDNIITLAQKNKKFTTSCSKDVT